MERLRDQWEEEFKLVSHNPIYFIELYWNKLYPNEKVELTDEEKQRFYDKYRGIPVFKWDDFDKEMKRKEELKEKGYKDWEAFL